MKILVDACVALRVVEQLKLGGHEVEWVGDWGMDPGDEEILERAFKNKKILITLDKDFGELAVVLGKSHFGILRLVDLSIQQQAESCLDILPRCESQLSEGAILTVEPGRLRIRPA
ncbi:MAG: DUF5615 family PIN-like protein [Deltaproteobacteria bacterium]|nr:DUF5615 family PIN-like protein [Deltaproteobacteria bacterium]MBI4223675.1 DUF5615 family PIN-like protein [Deltaproteobacteria bacterium]